MSQTLVIVEHNRSAGEVERGETLPHWIGQVGAGFHGDGEIHASGDSEREVFSLHAEAGAAGLQATDSTKLPGDRRGKRTNPSCPGDNTSSPKIPGTLENPGWEHFPRKKCFSN